MGPLELDQNRYALPDEAELLHEQIRADLATKEALWPSKLLAQSALGECQAAIVAAQAAMESARATYEDILAREAELDTRVSHARGRFQSLRRVPDEIICIIFHEWLLGCPTCADDTRCVHVCTIAAAVCRWWRRVALSLPMLWRKMTVRVARVKAHNIQDRISYMETHRSRSGRMGLHLHVSGGWLSRYTVEPELLDTFWASLKRCVGQARLLVMDAEQVIAGEALCRLLDQDAPSLVDCRIDIRSVYDGPLRLFRSAPLLQRMTLGRSLALALDPGQPGFLAVTQAKLAHTDARGLRDAALAMPNLASLHVHRCILATSAPSGFTVRSDTLRTLKWTHCGKCEEALIGCMHFPRLVVAELGFDEWALVPDTTVTAFLQHPMCTVQEMTLDFLDLAAMRGLRYTHRVTTLRFKKYARTSEAALRDLSQPTPGVGWLCARLTDVYLPSDTEHFGVTALKDAILNFARARGPRAAPVAPWSRPQTVRSLKFKSEYHLRTLPRSLDQHIADILNPGPET